MTIANQVSISDVDRNDVQTKYVAGTLAFDAAHSSGHGVSASQFTLDTATGTISYDKAAFDYLSGGETVVAKFTFNASSGPDTQTKTITLTIHGTNDAAVIGTPTVADVTEDTAAPTLTAVGSISISDVDSGEAHFQTTVAGAAGNLGALVLAADGSYSYSVANADVQFLAGSNANGGTSTHVDTFTVTAADGTSQLVSFTIHGTNDAAVIGTPTVADVTEDTAAPTLTAVGSISISDVDSGEAHFQTTVAGAAGNLGALVLAADGSYTYSVANADVQFLAGSNANGGTSTHVDTFTVTAADGTSQIVSFTIHGTNDDAMIGTPTVADVTEETAAPTLTAWDRFRSAMSTPARLTSRPLSPARPATSAPWSWPPTAPTPTRSPTPTCSSSPAAMPMAAPAPMSTPSR